MEIFILYKDYSIKSIPVMSISNRNIFTDSNIYMILIPYGEDSQAYIPIKSTKYLNFYKADIDIEYEGAVYTAVDYETFSRSGTKHYKVQCRNIVEFGNAIYNLKKFNEIPDFIISNLEVTEYSLYSFYMYPIRIQCRFYDRQNTLIEEIDTGIMKSIKVKNSQLKNHDLDRLEYFEDLFFDIYNLRERSIFDKLYPFIEVSENYENWLNKQNTKGIRPVGHIFYNIAGFSLYYLMSLSLYEALNKVSFEIEIFNVWTYVRKDRNPQDFDDDIVEDMVLKYDDLIELKSSNKKNIKQRILDEIKRGDLFINDITMIAVDNTSQFLIAKVLLKAIINYYLYFAMTLYKDVEDESVFRDEHKIFLSAIKDYTPLSFKVYASRICPNRYEAKSAWDVEWISDENVKLLSFNEAMNTSLNDLINWCIKK